MFSSTHSRAMKYSCFTVLVSPIRIREKISHIVLFPRPTRRLVKGLKLFFSEIGSSLMVKLLALFFFSLNNTFSLFLSPFFKKKFLTGEEWDFEFRFISKNFRHFLIQKHDRQKGKVKIKSSALFSKSAKLNGICPNNNPKRKTWC